MIAFDRQRQHGLLRDGWNERQSLTRFLQNMKWWSIHGFISAGAIGIVYHSNARGDDCKVGPEADRLTINCPT